MNIFLTGATGFVGAQLIQSLAQDTNKRFYILYRSERKKTALLNQTDVEVHNRMHFIKGDITKINCGIDNSELNTIANIDVFYHLAALVKFNLELADELYNINYIGTQHAVHLAKLIHTKKFIYVSTAYTLGTKETAYELLHDENTTTNNPYEYSKIQAEHYVATQKDMEYSIVRPAIIIGDSKTGEADSGFTLYGFMKALKVFKRRVDRSGNHNKYRLFGDPNFHSNFVPVDYVVRVLTVASDYSEDKKIYHAINNNPPSNLFIFNTIKKHLGFEQLEVANQSEMGTITDEERILNSYVDVFAPYLIKTVKFDEKNTKEMLQKVNQSVLNMDNETLDMIIGTYFKGNESKV